uniref:LAGLIDADG endonuclease n=1 Tax=Ophiognomonia clavigignenti-juglandacearum TaxID=218668 RepID=A0A2C9DSD9_9PEZI|nr:LAGLIDADG endonuclease [Ophiognomonia clavigignenti-juglandacearum]
MRTFYKKYTKGGESNFFIALSNPKGSGTSTRLRFSIGQDSRDIALLESVVKFFGCGKVYRIKNREVCEFVVTKVPPRPLDAYNKINKKKYIFFFFFFFFL